MGSQAHVSEQLRPMDWEDLLDGFEFDRKPCIDEQVVTIAAIPRCPAIVYAQRCLAGMRDAEGL